MSSHETNMLCVVDTHKFYQVGILTKDKIINDSGEVELV